MSQLVDTTSSTTGFERRSLSPPGRRSSTPVSNVTITTLSASPSGAVVRISWEGAPPPPGDAHGAIPAREPGGDRARREPRLRDVEREHRQRRRHRLPHPAQLEPRDHRDRDRLHRHRPLTRDDLRVPGRRRGRAPATRASPASASATTPSDTAPPPPPPPPADTEAPSTPQNLVATAGKGKKVLLSWGACTDNVAVAGYRVYRDGKLLGTVQAPGYTDTLGGKSRTATYTVVAVDAAGNTSAPAQAAYATRPRRIRPARTSQRQTSPRRKSRRPTAERRPAHASEPRARR